MRGCIAMTGRVVAPSRLQRVTTRTATAIPLKGVRNTAATTLIAAGLSPVDAAAWLGHDAAMTLRVYAHARREGLIEAADALTRPS